MDIFGHTTDGDTRTPKESNIAALADFPRPTTQKELNSFVGLASFFRGYVNVDGMNFAQLAAPLYEWKKGGRKVVRRWTDVHEAAFIAIKDAHSEPPSQHANQTKINTPTRGLK